MSKLLPLTRCEINEFHRRWRIVGIDATRAAATAASSGVDWGGSSKTMIYEEMTPLAGPRNCGYKVDNLRFIQIMNGLSLLEHRLDAERRSAITNLIERSANTRVVESPK